MEFGVYYRNYMPEFDDQTTELVKAIETLNRHQRLWPSFMRGVMSGLGATIGVAIVFALLGFLLQQLAVFPALRDEIQSVLGNVSQINRREIPLPENSQLGLPEIEEKVKVTSD